jgi:hypothetical protein
MEFKGDDGTVVGSLRAQWPQCRAIPLDSRHGGRFQGNVYTAEVDTGKRIQKFRLTSDALR